MNNIPIGNMYEINQQLVNKENPLSNKEIDLKRTDLINYFKNKETYYMLLCKELSDYTVYVLKDSFNSRQKASYEVIETLKERGTIYAIDKQKNGSYEIWLKPFMEDLPHVYYLFPYSKAVIEC